MTVGKRLGICLLLALLTSCASVGEAPTTDEPARSPLSAENQRVKLNRKDFNRGIIEDYDYTDINKSELRWFDTLDQVLDLYPSEAEPQTDQTTARYWIGARHDEGLDESQEMEFLFREIRGEYRLVQALYTIHTKAFDFAGANAIRDTVLDRLQEQYGEVQHTAQTEFDDPTISLKSVQVYRWHAGHNLIEVHVSTGILGVSIVESYSPFFDEFDIDYDYFGQYIVTEPENQHI